MSSPFRCFTYISTHSPTLPLLHLRHSSFSNPSFASPTSQDFHSAHSPSFQSLHLHHSSFSNPSVALPTSQLIPQPFRCFTYVTVHSLTLLLLLLLHRISLCSFCSFSKLSVASPASQPILQPFCCFTSVTAHSPILPLIHLHHSSLSNPSFASRARFSWVLEHVNIRGHWCLYENDL